MKLLLELPTAYYPQYSIVIFNIHILVTCKIYLCVETMPKTLSHEKGKQHCIAGEQDDFINHKSCNVFDRIPCLLVLV